VIVVGGHVDRHGAVFVLVWRHHHAKMTTQGGKVTHVKEERRMRAKARALAARVQCSRSFKSCLRRLHICALPTRANIHPRDIAPPSSIHT
jgi:hypothetical protein